MINNGLSQRFDLVMAHLKPIEPSPAINFEFRRRLKETIVARYEAGPIERLGLALDRLRYVIALRPMVVARATIAFVAVSAGCLGLYALQGASPEVTAKSGSVMVQGRGGAVITELSGGGRLKAGDVIVTKAGSEVDLALSDKYAVRIKEGSTVRLARLTTRIGRSNVIFKLESGKMLVTIGDTFKPSRFIVETDGATATALGTKFAVDITKKEKALTSVNVFEGTVKVKARAGADRRDPSRQEVRLEAGQKTNVVTGQIPDGATRLAPDEWRELDELYRLGKKPLVMLLITHTPDRVLQLLRPCPIYISDDKPRELPRLIEDAAQKIAEALKTHDPATHLQAVRMLERIADTHPEKRYNVQLLLYVGSYYEYLGQHEEAILAFRKVADRYPDSPLASMADCAIGIIYKDKAGDIAKADEAFNLVLAKYPDSLEAIYLQDRPSAKN